MFEPVTYSELNVFACVQTDRSLLHAGGSHCKSSPLAAMSRPGVEQTQPLLLS